MKQDRVEFVGKVFVVVGGMRRCLVCDRVFAPTQAAKHATVPCSLRSRRADADTLTESLIS